MLCCSPDVLIIIPGVVPTYHTGQAAVTQELCYD